MDYMYSFLKIPYILSVNICLQISKIVIEKIHNFGVILFDFNKILCGQLNLIMINSQEEESLFQDK